MKKQLLILSFIVFSIISYAQDGRGYSDPNELKSICDEIVDKFNSEEILEAFEILDEIFVLPSNEIRLLEKQTVESLNLVEGRFGETIGNVHVSTKDAGGVVMKVTYVVRYENHGIRIIFLFYKGGEDLWFLNSFKWDDKLSELFDD